jgi:hypothetical protein
MDCLRKRLAQKGIALGALPKAQCIPRNPKAELTIGWPAPASEKMLAFA